MKLSNLPPATAQPSYAPVTELRLATFEGVRLVDPDASVLGLTFQVSKKREVPPKHVCPLCEAGFPLKKAKR